MRCAYALLSVLLYAPLAAASAQLGLVPAPASMTVTRGSFKILPSTRVLTSGDPQVQRVAEYGISLLEPLGGSGATGIAKPGARPDNAIILDLQPVPGADPESYDLEVSPQHVIIAASDTRGLRYGLVTLWQLLSAAREPNQIPALRITDQPRFRWRGLMLDSARHYQSPTFIKRFIDQMALHKLNVLHWHLTDDQAWRIEIKQYPRLTALGAWRIPAGAAAQKDVDPATGQLRRYGGYYSQVQVREIVAHAAQRGVTVVPEIEMPGHASAAIVAYPHLGVSPVTLTAVPADWGVYANLFNVEEATFKFLENVLGEVIALFPGEYIHVGGDEAVKDQWRHSDAVQRRMRELEVADEHGLQSYFIQRIGKFLDQHGRRLIGWDEILEGGLAPNATVMSWRGLEGAVAAATAGHDTVLSPWPTLYLDNRNSDSLDQPPGRGRVVGLRDIYAFDPAPVQIQSAQQRHILGVQANLWTEHVRTEDRVEHMAFPRTAALAEVAWTAPAHINWEDFTARMPVQMRRYAQQGIRYSRVDGVTQPAQHPRSANSRSSHELRLCSDKLVLALEDDAPLDGKRAVFLVDIMNPCWIFPGVDRTQRLSLSIDVGQVPFNFQIGTDVQAIELNGAATRAAELEVFGAGCEGERLASVALTTAFKSSAVTRLAPLVIPPIAIAATVVPKKPSLQDLCFKFSRSQVDPIWVIDRIQLNSGTPSH